MLCPAGLDTHSKVKSRFHLDSNLLVEFVSLTLCLLLHKYQRRKKTKSHFAPSAHALV